MTREDEFIGALEGYLDEYQGLTPLPDTIRNAVRAEVPSTRQIGSIKGPMKYLSASMAMPASARYGLMAAVVVVAAALGAAFFTRAGGTGTTSTPMPTPTPGAATTAGAATLIEPTGDIDTYRDLPAGSYYVDRPFPVHLTFQVPQGIELWAYNAAGSQVNMNMGAGEVSFEIVDNISADPCTSQMLDPPVGPSVEDLVTALSNLPRFNATDATDVAIDGFRGKQFSLTAPGGNHARCSSMLTWKTTTRQNGVGMGETDEVTILDVEGVRLLISIAYQPITSAADVSPLRAFVDSVQIDPQ